MKKLKPCPFCGSENIYVDGYAHAAGQRWRVVCLDCMATVDPGTIQQKYRAIEAWNRRPAPENKPLTLDELRKMDGEPVYAQAGDGTEGWAIVFWNSPETLFLYGPEFDSIFEPDLDFINMTYNDPDGHFGLHIFGWRALRHKPDAETECKKK